MQCGMTPITIHALDSEYSRSAIGLHKLLYSWKVFPWHDNSYLDALTRSKAYICINVATPMYKIYMIQCFVKNDGSDASSNKCLYDKPLGANLTTGLFPFQSYIC